MEKQSTMGRVLGGLSGAAIGSTIPALLMRNKLKKTDSVEEKDLIKKKYLKKIFLSGGIGALAGSSAGALISNRKNIRDAQDARIKIDMANTNFPKRNVLMSTAIGTFLGALPGAYNFHKSKTEEEKAKAKRTFGVGATIGGIAGGGYGTIKHVDKGLQRWQ